MLGNPTLDDRILCTSVGDRPSSVCRTWSVEARLEGRSRSTVCVRRGWVVIILRRWRGLRFNSLRRYRNWEDRVWFSLVLVWL